MITFVITLIVALITPAVVMAESVPTPKSITLVCDDNIQQGTVVLSDPPKFSCKDYELAKSVIGLGITVGPDTRVLQISRAIKRANRQIKSANAVPVIQASKSPVEGIRLGDWGGNEERTNPFTNDPVRDNTHGSPRGGWTGSIVVKDDPQPKNVSWQEVRRAHLEEEWRRNNQQLDDSSQWINIGSFEDEYKRFDGFSRNRKFFRQWK
jgi:hypothetical protein